MDAIGKEEAPGRGSPVSRAKLDLLGSLSLFSRVSAPVLGEVAKAAQPHIWPAGRLLFQRGDPSSYLIAMERGHIRISLQTRSGREFVLQHVRGAAIVGEVGLLDGSTRTADATVAAETAGWIIDGRKYIELTNLYPELAQAAIRHLCGLVRYTTDHIETIALYSLEARLARFLLSAARRAHGGEPSALLEFRLDLNQSEIADLIGSSRPKVNRALVALEQMGAIRRIGKSISCNHDELALIATESTRSAIEK